MGQNRSLGDPRYKHLLALIAQAAGQGSPFTVAATFVLRPGGVQYRNVFTTWAALMAAFRQLDPSTKKFVVIDNSLADCHVTTAASAPGGAWNVNQTYFWAAVAGGGSTRNLIIDDGAAFVFNYMDSENVVWICNASAPPIDIANVGNNVPAFHLRFGAMQSTAGSAPLIRIRSAGLIGLTLHDRAQIANGGAPVFQVDAGATQTVRCFDATTISPSSFTGAGAIIATASAEAIVSASQPGVTGSFTIQLLAMAPQVAYTPADATKWVGPAPTTVQQALDRIAANTTNTHPIP